MPVLYTAFITEGIPIGNLAAAIRTVFWRILPWCTVYTGERIRIIHRIADPLAAGVAEIEMCFSFALPCDQKFLLGCVSPYRFCGTYSPATGFTEESVSVSVFRMNDLEACCFHRRPLSAAVKYFVNSR